MNFLEIIGGFVVSAVGLALLVLIGTILLNIYWGFIGAMRFSAIRQRGGGNGLSIRSKVKLALRNWHGGQRYDGSCGTYIVMGGMKVSLDGRDKIHRERF